MFTYIAIGIVSGIVVCAAFVGVLVLVQNFFARKSREANSLSSLPFNPVTGLPMAGVLDTGGNFYGQNNTQINPATGLRMVGGIGGIDAGGNYYGHNSRE